MSASDLWMRDLVTKYGLIVIVVIAVSALISWKWSRFRQNHFKKFLLGFETECSELASTHKKRLFDQLREHVSHDDTLRSLGRIRILEIGVKTGDNVQYYPEGSHVIGVDWNRKLADYLINGDRAWQFGHVIFERLIIGDGSSLKAVQSESVDVVVATRALCSAKSPNDALLEIHRILAPGGKFLFLEHVPDRRSSFVGYIQMILTKTKIWPSLFGGCRLDSNPMRIIESAGFKDIDCERVVLQGYVSQPHHLLLSRHHVIGSATR